ncbi:adenine deaminase [Desulfosporosinus fructosivorans]|uniref:Adenine deaminase n=1 Tax=Desulfosporosinus fructosivorans TaxID=2018669 RepID=A0A4Z0R869_9FIRM|nr:adenine deaminase [Desulfosporosinus fructosivorans]TGE38605.1 adenine deaminase [Desulfosporosinus fructosivorans]
MRTYEEIKTVLEAGLSISDCDLKLENVKLVNVYSSQIYPTNIYIKGKRIVSIDPLAELKAKKTLDCGGMYAVPGLIDGHMHVETTLLSPEALADVLVPQGTTTIMADLMEIANVAGIDGVKELVNSIAQLPYRTFIQVSSRVPTAPGLETTGGILGLAEVEEMLDWPESISLGELDPSKVLVIKEEYLKKIAAALQRRKVVNGHAIGRDGQELNVYASAGMSDDHECVTYEHLLERVQLGMTVMLREGSTERNVEELIIGVLKHGLSHEHLIFCTDDKHAIDIREEGHINYNVNKAISLGMPPMQAIQMATLNSARHFRLEDEIGSITPGRLADILLVKDITNITPVKVIFEGEVVAENGQLVVGSQQGNYPEWIKETIKLKKPIDEHSFVVPAKSQGSTTRVNVIRIYNDQIINEWDEEELPVANGQILSSPEKDIFKLAIAERYGKTGGVGIGFVKGFQLKKGALATSMSHDHHNIVCVGTNDQDMACAVNAIHKLQGGMVVVNDGQVIGKMELPIGGLMSEKPAEIVIKELEDVNAAARQLGCLLPSPFMTLCFISLPTVPKLGLTDLGLVDVLNHKLIDLEL